MIKKKLTILKENDVIDEQTEKTVLKAGDMLLEKDLITDLDEADVFLTHLAMALSREEEINQVDNSIKEQLSSHRNYEQTVKLWGNMKDELGLNLSENENDYMYMHLLTLIE